MKLVHDTRPDDIGVSVSYPLPGTKFFERVQAQLGEKTNWSDSEDLAMMFQGAYTDEFYRALHDALHAQVDSWNSVTTQDHREMNTFAILSPDELWKQVAATGEDLPEPSPHRSAEFCRPATGAVAEQLLA